MSTPPAETPGLAFERQLAVGRVTRDEAIAFCEGLTKRDRASGALPEGRIYRLPNQREWLIAALPGGRIPIEEALDEEAWLLVNSAGHLHAAGSKNANADGLHDLFGNVAEWAEPDAQAARVLAEIFRNRLEDLEAKLKGDDDRMRTAQDKMRSLIEKDFPINDGLSFPDPQKWNESELKSEQADAASELGLRRANEYRDARDEFRELRKQVSRTEKLVGRATFVITKSQETPGSSMALGGNLFDGPEDLLLPDLVSDEDHPADGIGFRFVMADE